MKKLPKFPVILRFIMVPSLGLGIATAILLPRDESNSHSLNPLEAIAQGNADSAISVFNTILRQGNRTPQEVARLAVSSQKPLIDQARNPAGCIIDMDGIVEAIAVAVDIDTAQDHRHSDHVNSVRLQARRALTNSLMNGPCAPRLVSPASG